MSSLQETSISDIYQYAPLVGFHNIHFTLAWIFSQENEILAFNLNSFHIYPRRGM